MDFKFLNTEALISAIKLKSRDVINIIKRLHHSNDFKPVIFNQGKVAFILNEIKHINQDPNVSPVDETKALYLKFQGKYKKLKKKFQELEGLNQKLEIEKGVLNEQKRMELQWLKQENERITKINEELLIDRKKSNSSVSSKFQKAFQQAEVKDKTNTEFRYTEINRMTKKEKCDFAISAFDLRKDLDQVFDDLLISNDGQFGFLCMK